ncbi:alpha/beta hydrolase [Pinibacter soli]|uniref:Alpha/beta hydrolase n=1 Tax=Pinibacter soli TaxID=3044211 RepID=A0ABT6RJH5_9BACT|nr:alpha/beta hydrolase [Pinibacter soli]MDI3322545.1 alpha/beta hydrolase [Pinibacter soli]
MKKWMLVPGLILLVLAIVYVLGPAPSKPLYSNNLPVVPSGGDSLKNYIASHEAGHKVKPDNEARIIWANDSLKNVTEYSIIYLHGFSASQAEGAPTHTDIAKKFGCNLYLSRLAEHGIDTSDAMINLTADEYWESAKEALEIGKKIGKKVILMGTSTGGTQALQLAATFPDQIAGLILYSPNIAINDPNAWILNNHWGLQVARKVMGSDYKVSDDTRPVYKQYWDYKYRLEAAVALQEMLETTMTKETFEKVKQPVLLLYYYKDEEHQDPVVKVSAMRKMFDELGTSANLKREKAMPNTGNHVIGSYIKSGDVEGVKRETESFMKEVLGMHAAN